MAKAKLDVVDVLYLIHFVIIGRSFKDLKDDGVDVNKNTWTSYVKV